MRLKSRDSAPTFGAIDMPLSLTTMTIGMSMPPALRRASNETPPVSAPSPITATTLPSGATPRRMASLMPTAYDTLVEAWPAPMMSCSDSCDRAEGRESAVLADRVQLVAAAGEDLVRVGLVAHVPEHLVARGVEQRVDRHGDLARAEVRAEVAADLADRVDDQLADLLRDLRELLVVEALQVGRAVDFVEEVGHVVRVRM